MYIQINKNNEEISTITQYLQLASTVWYKILEGENHGEFGELQEIGLKFPF